MFRKSKTRTNRLHGIGELMLKELKNLFTTRNGALLVLSMVTLAICAYLNIITVKSLDLNALIAGTGNYYDWFKVSLGTLMVSFIPMITSEIICEVYGWKKGFIISSVAYTVCLVFTIILDLTTRVGFNGNVYDIFGIMDTAADPFGEIAGFVDVNGFEASYNTVFAGSYVIIIASAVAYYLGIFFNCFIMGKMKKKAQESGTDNNGKRFGRFLLSTVVGQTLDNGVFFLIPMIVVSIVPALHQGALAPWCWEYVGFQTAAAFVIEIAYEAIFFPLTNFLTKRVSKLPVCGVPDEWQTRA